MVDEKRDTDQAAGYAKAKDRFPGIKNGWTEKIKELAGELQNLRGRLISKDSIIDAMRIALAARDKVMGNIILDLTQEKQANLRWEEFAHSAIAECKKHRDMLIDCGMDPEEIKERISHGRKL